MADDDQVVGGAGDDLTANLVGGRPQDGTPDAGGEGSQEKDEEPAEEPARREPAYFSRSDLRSSPVNAHLPPHPSRPISAAAL